MLDLSVATLIGLSSIAAMVAWNPYPLELEGRLYSEQASLRDHLVSVVSTLGVSWLHTANPDVICAALLSMSNSTVQLSATGRNYLCSTGPPGDLPSSSLTLEFAEGNLTLRAWQLAKP